MPARGRHPHNKLNNLVVGQALPGRHADGQGLYLFVRASGARQWIQRIVIDGRRRDLGLGPYPCVSLAEARRVALEHRRTIRTGGDPTAKAPPFRTALESVTDMRRKAWKQKTTEASWFRLFKNYVLPVIGDRPVDRVTLSDLEGIIVPIGGGSNTKGYLLRQNLEAVFAWVVASGYRVDNPAAALKTLLPPVTTVVKNRSSLPYSEAPDALAEWQALSINEGVKLALLFLVLTAARLGEVTAATWQEIDCAERRWRVPASRMKRKKEHRVPLSLQALDVLERARALRNNSSLLFPLRPRGAKRQVTQDALSDAVTKLHRVDEWGDPIVVHGFRTTFRVWAMEQDPASFQVCEAALSHGQPNKTVKAYARSDLFDLRVPLMQRWADYVLPRPPAAGGR